MPIYQFEDKRPRIGAGSFVHPTAVIIGGVSIGKNCYIGPGVSLRGDFGTIEVGDGSNIQDNCVIHGIETVLGPNSHIGHCAVIHGARLGEHVLVGMNAVVLDGAVVGDGVIVGAGAVVAPRANIPAGKLVMGVPAAIISDVSPERQAGLRQGTQGYQELAARSLRGLRPISLAEVLA